MLMRRTEKKGEVMFKQYQSLPKQVEAVRFTDATKDGVISSCDGNVSPDHEDGNPILKVTTIYGETAIIRLGDWIVRDSNPGTYYPVKHDIFCRRYVWCGGAGR